MGLLTGSAYCIRYLLLSFNLAFVITGIILIAVGVAVDAIYAEYHIFLETKFFSIPTLLIVTGCFIIIITIFGCWSAFRENYLQILIFTVLLGIIFILELSAGISGYVLRSNAESLLRKSLNESLNQYNNTTPNDQTILWDYVQRTFTCCGIENSTDWTSKFNSSLPLSCCKIPNGVVGNFTCNLQIGEDIRYKTGCLAEFTAYIADHAVSLGTAGSLIAILQFFGVLFAYYIAREIKIRNGNPSIF